MDLYDKMFYTPPTHSPYNLPTSPYSPTTEIPEGVGNIKKNLYKLALAFGKFIDVTNIIEKPLVRYLSQGQHKTLPEWWTERESMQSLPKWADVSIYILSNIASTLMHPITYAGIPKLPKWMPFTTEAALKNIPRTGELGASTFFKKMTPTGAIGSNIRGIEESFSLAGGYTQEALSKLKVGDDISTNFVTYIDQLKNFGTPTGKRMTVFERIHDFVAKKETIDVQTDLLVNNIKKYISPAEREAITHAIEDPIKFSGLATQLQKDVLDHWKNVSPKLWLTLKGKGLIDDFVENYISHILPPELKAPVITEISTMLKNKFSKFSPFFLPRQMKGTIEEINAKLIKGGITPLAVDFADLIGIYLKSTGRALVNNEFVKDLSMMTTKDGLAPIVNFSQLLSKGKALPKLAKGELEESVGKYSLKELEKQGYVKIATKPGQPLHNMYIHPELAKPLENLMYNFPLTEAMRKHWVGALGNTMRRIIMANPLIHGSNLIKIVLASGINPLGAMMRGASWIQKNDPIIMEATLAGLQWPKVTHILETAYNGVAKQMPNSFMRRILQEPLQKLAGVSDRFLWEGIGRNLSIAHYQAVRDNMLKWAKWLKIEEKLGGEKGIQQMAAQMTNITIGTVPTHTMNSMYRDIANVSLFAPRWTLTHIDIALKSMKILQPILKKINPNLFIPEIYGAKIFTPFQESFAAVQFLSHLLRGFTMAYVVNSYLNHTFSGKAPWQNEEGKEWSVDTGVTMTDEKGTSRKLYINTLGWLHDYFSYRDHFFRTVVNKLNPVFSSVGYLFAQEQDPVYTSTVHPIARYSMKMLKGTLPGGSYIWENRDKMTPEAWTALLLGQRVMPGRTLKTQRRIIKARNKLGGDLWEMIEAGDREGVLDMFREAWHKY